jgi:hypothetical protein
MRGFRKHLLHSNTDLLPMVEVIPWNMVFNLRNTEETKILFLLYWYFFNTPDYPTHLIDEVKTLEKKYDVPEGICHEGSISKYLKKMEEYNLISRVDYDERSLIWIEDTRKSPTYYQALPFFYLDPFCITTPQSIGGNIEAHFQEYKKKIEKLQLISKNSYKFIFNPHKNNTVLPAQILVQELSKEPREVLKYALKFDDKIIHCLTLYTLIRDSYLELKEAVSIAREYLMICRDGSVSASTAPFKMSFKILDKEKIIEKIKKHDENSFFQRSSIHTYEQERYEECKKILQDCAESISNLKKVSQSSDSEQYIRDQCVQLITNYEKEILNYRNHLWKIIDEHLEHLVSNILNEIHPLYIDVELGYKKFNPHTLTFE